MTDQLVRARSERPAERARWRLGQRTRKVMLTLHVAVSVGWLGAALTMMMLGLAATGGDAALRHGGFVALHDSDRLVMIPLSLAALGTGLVVSLGSKWGLLRHYWVATKLVLTVVAMLFAALYVSQQIKAAVALTAQDPTADLSALRARVVAGSAAMLLVLATNTTLSVVKPWGRTRRGRAAVRRR